MDSENDLLIEEVSPEDVDTSSLVTKSSLNPALWENIDGKWVLKEKAKSAFDKAIRFFESQMHVRNEPIEFDTVILTGSNAGYNWYEGSDIDLHFRVLYSSIDDDIELVDDILWRESTIFSLKYRLKYAGFDIECYIEDSAEEHNPSQARYDLIKGSWENEPKENDVSIDFDVIKEKCAKIMNMIDEANTKEELSLIKNKLRKYRESGINKDGEYSESNLVYKVLRRNGTLVALNDKIEEKQREKIFK
jgi:hypothetical protein